MTAVLVRRFQKPNGEAINQKVERMEFRSDDNWKTHSGWMIPVVGLERPGGAWTLHQAEQLVASGNWVELFNEAPADACENYEPQTRVELVW